MAKEGFKRRKAGLLRDLKLVPVEVLQSRIHCEVIRCRDEDGRDLALKILKLPRERHKFAKEAQVLKTVRPKAPLCFPKIVSSADDYIITRFEPAPHIGYEDIRKEHLGMIIAALTNLHQISIKAAGPAAVWDPGFTRLYFWRALYWLCYVSFEYLSLAQIFKMISLVLSGQKSLAAYVTIGHRSFALENMHFDPAGRYIFLTDFEDFVLRDNFLYDAAYLSGAPDQLYRDWTWQKDLLSRCIAEMKEREGLALSDELIARNLRTTLLLVSLHQLGMCRINDEQNRLFRRMSPAFVLSRSILRILRLLKVCRPGRLSEKMKIRKENLLFLFDQDAFNQLYRDILKRR